MKSKVYLETSFVSYLAGRLSQDLTALQRQLSSQRWWAERRRDFDLFTSEAVYKECAQGDRQATRDREMILGETTLLPLTDEILKLAKRLIDPGPFPVRASTDALHIAAATAYGCDYLLTWNFKHINNARIKRESLRIIEEYGYEPTTICTPDGRSWDLTTPQKDEIVEEIHAWRVSYAAQFDYDLDRMFQDLKAQEATNPARRATLKPLKPHERRP